MSRKREGSLRLVDHAPVATPVGDMILSHGLERVDVQELPMAKYKLSDVNILEQTRSEYDPDGIVELAKSMVEVEDDGNVSIKLIHRPIMLEFDDTEALSLYLKEYDSYYKTETDPGKLFVNEGATVLIINAGHRRSLAFQYIALQYGVSYDDFTFPATKKLNPNFISALSDQVRENIHDRPSQMDEIRQIDRFYKYLSAVNPARRPTFKQCGDALGLSDEKVSNALKFTQLPDEVKSEFEKSNITYEQALLLVRLQVAASKLYGVKYADVYRLKGERTLRSDVRDELMTAVNKLKSKEFSRRSAEDKRDSLLARINTLLGEIDYDALLFDGEFEATPPERRALASKALARKACEVTVQSVGLLVQTSEGRQQLMDLMAAAENALGDVQVEDELDEPMMELVSIA